MDSWMPDHLRKKSKHGPDKHMKPTANLSSATLGGRNWRQDQQQSLDKAVKVMSA